MCIEDVAGADNGRAQVPADVRDLYAEDIKELQMKMDRAISDLEDVPDEEFDSKLTIKYMMP